MVTQVGIDDHVARSEEPFFAEVDGEIVILSISTGRYYQVGPVGTAIWNRMETPVAVRSICEELMDRFDVDEESCRMDVLTFLEELLDDDLVQIVPEPQSA